MANDEPDLLKGVDPEEAARVRALGTRIRLTSGAVLFELGAPADSVFVVERGRVNLTLPMHIGGREQDVLVEERQPGETLGWSGLIPPHHFTLKAMAPLETEVTALPREALLAYLTAHPAVGFTVIRNLAAVIGERLHIVQAMWLREMQRVVELRS
jgi:CRP-like cAMP-binding protein